jgi:hypothetical protein
MVPMRPSAKRPRALPRKAASKVEMVLTFDRIFMPEQLSINKDTRQLVGGAVLSAASCAQAHRTERRFAAIVPHDNGYGPREVDRADHAGGPR